MASASTRPITAKGGPKDTLPRPESLILSEALGSGSYATVYKAIKKVESYNFMNLFQLLRLTAPSF